MSADEVQPFLVTSKQRSLTSVWHQESLSGEEPLGRAEGGAAAARPYWLEAAPGRGEVPPKALKGTFLEIPAHF